ncbi:MAG: hypothetical protein ACTHXA_11835 [Gulosibacter sp.]|uniref:hypothetical protein n=1 Tax=Gulosibacter sp. TaxID=2817531 RepID=UPI003F92C0D6
MLETLVRRFEDALAVHWPNSILSYSFKTNSLPWLISYMRKRNVWAEVVSDTEYELALALEYGADRIIYNGPIKSRERLRFALRNGSITNLDAKREVSWAAELAREYPETKFVVGLRVNWDLENYVPEESTAGIEGSRFGFNANNGDLDRAIQELTAAGVRVAGLHMHRNSRTQSLEVFRTAGRLAAELVASRGLQLDWLDIGGGFFGSIDGTPTFDDYVRVILESVGQVIDPNQTRLIVEPGGSLIAVPVEFHASVVDVKDLRQSRFVVTDASRTDIDPLFRRRGRFQFELATNTVQTHPEQIISGFTCMEDDRLINLVGSPELKVDDRIVFHKVGAYTMSFQSTFIEFLPPVYVRGHDSFTLVRRKWEVNDYLQGNEW